MIKEEVSQKFHTFASAAFPSRKREAIIEAVTRLTCADRVSELAELLVFPPDRVSRQYSIQTPGALK